MATSIATLAMAPGCEEPSRLEAMRKVFQENYDSLKRELELEITTLNSKLYTKGLIFQDLSDSASIDKTMSAVSRRLQNDTCTELTFHDFVDVVSQITSKSHLKSTLLKALSRELKEEFMYLDSAKPAHTSTGDMFLSAHPTSLQLLEANTVTPLTGSTAGTWPNSEKRDSAIQTSSLFTDVDEFPLEQATDEDTGRQVIVCTASGTMQSSTQHVHTHELENRIRQLKTEKQASQKLARDKTSDAKETNRQLEEALCFLQSKDDEAEGLYQQLDCLKEELALCKQKLEEQEEKNKEIKAQNLELAEKVYQGENKLHEMEERVRQADIRVCQTKKQANGLILEPILKEGEQLQETIKILQVCSKLLQEVQQKLEKIEKKW